MSDTPPNRPGRFVLFRFLGLGIIILSAGISLTMISKEMSERNPAPATTSLSEYSAPYEMRARMKDASLGCESYEDVEFQSSATNAEATCVLDGKTLRMTVYQDRDDLENELGNEERVNDTFGGMVSVVGENWIVSSVDDQELGQRIARVLKGQVVDFDAITSGTDSGAE